MTDALTEIGAAAFRAKERTDRLTMTPDEEREELESIRSQLMSLLVRINNRLGVLERAETATDCEALA